MKLFSTTATNLILTASLLAIASGCSTPSEPPAAATQTSVQSTPATTAATATATAQTSSAAAPATVASSTPAKPASPKADLEKIQGNWKGEEVGADDGTATLKISGQDIEYRGSNPNDWYKGTLTLREDTKPKQCVLVVTGCAVPDYVGKNCMAIYELANGTLTIAGNEPGNPDPPSSFGSQGARLFKFKLQ